MLKIPLQQLLGIKLFFVEEKTVLIPYWSKQNASSNTFLKVYDHTYEIEYVYWHLVEDN